MKYLIKTDDISQIKGGGVTDYDRIVMDDTTNDIYFYDAFETVDLGLPSGTLWATKNIGAKNPYDLGLFFNYNNKEEISGFTKEQINAGEKKFTIGTWGYATGENKTNWEEILAENDYILPDKCDPATVVLGKNVQVPTLEQIQELADNTYTEYVEIDDTPCVKFISNNDSNKYLIIPIVNSVSSSVNQGGKKCYIMSNKLSSYATAYCLIWDDGTVKIVNSQKVYFGYTLRPVLKN